MLTNADEPLSTPSQVLRPVYTANPFFTQILRDIAALPAFSKGHCSTTNVTSKLNTFMGPKFTKESCSAKTFPAHTLPKWLTRVG
jgi:hypothetical protein